MFARIRVSARRLETETETPWRVNRLQETCDVDWCETTNMRERACVCVASLDGGRDASSRAEKKFSPLRYRKHVKFFVCIFSSRRTETKTNFLACSSDEETIIRRFVSFRSSFFFCHRVTRKPRDSVFVVFPSSRLPRSTQPIVFTPPSVTKMRK